MRLLHAATDSQSIRCNLWAFVSLVAILVVPSMGKAEFDKYAWSHRLVVVITKENQNGLRTGVDQFFADNACAVADRNLVKLFYKFGHETTKKLPQQMQNKTGLWLVGYDGEIKAFSSDTALLTQLFAKIDGMPMRKQEMQNIITAC